MTFYISETQNGETYEVHEKRIGLLLNEVWQDIRQDNISLIRYTDGSSYDDLGNNRTGFDYAVYTHGRDSTNLDIVIRYYVTISDEGLYSTDPIPLSYSTFVNDMLAYGDTLSIEDSETGEVLKAFAIRLGV